MSKRCIGCGVILQDIDINMDGYTADINYDVCQRCFMIKNYGRSKDTMKNNDDYLDIFNQIRDNDLVVYVSSILTLNMDYIDRFKNVILVITKWDIIPKAVKEGKIINYIKKRYSNIQEVIIVSANKKYGLDELYRVLNSKKSSDSDIYFVGITNSGKSTLLNTMIKSYSGIDGDITTSNYPSTTLGVVEARVGDIIIKDTPGMLVSNSVINFLNDKMIKRINTKKEIKPITFQVKGIGAKLIDEMIRIEYDTTVSSMTFYMTNNLSIKTISMNNPRLIDGKMQEFILGNDMDLVIEDIGFIKCTKGIKIKVYTDKEIMIRLRDNLI